MAVGRLLDRQILPRLLVGVVGPGDHIGEQVVLGLGLAVQHAVDERHGLRAGDAALGTERAVGITDDVSEVVGRVQTERIIVFNLDGGSGRDDGIIRIADGVGDRGLGEHLPGGIQLTTKTVHWEQLGGSVGVKRKFRIDGCFRVIVVPIAVQVGHTVGAGRGLGICQLDRVGYPRRSSR